MKHLPLSLAVSFMVVTFVIGLLVGYVISPTYQQTMFEKNMMGMGAADRYVDLRYINQMAAHHRGAILLAEQVQQKTQRNEIRELAAAIVTGEPKLINELYEWKKLWYKDGRVVKDPIVANLGPSDETIDLRFLNALIAHHQDGITMTKEIRTKSSRKEVLDNADAVEQFLSNGLVQLKQWRESWYGVK